MRFSLESLLCRMAVGRLFRKEVQGHRPSQTSVLGLVNQTHAVTAQLLDNPIMRNGLADLEEALLA